MRNWVLLKSGHLEIRERVPKNRVHVEEETREVQGDFQHYHHVWRLIGADNLPIMQEEFDSYCGQDRGPIRERRIKQLILSAHREESTE